MNTALHNINLSSYDIHKDAKLQSTLQKAKSILESIGLKDEDLYIRWCQPYDNCHSCTIIFASYPILRSNGKGLTKDAALVSAYAEFLERLQCTGNKHFSQLGAIIKERSFLHEHTLQTPEQLGKRLHHLFPNVNKELLYKLSPSLVCLSFCNVFENTIEELPIDLIYLGAATNGMCAGNSCEEALCQGIAEVMERYVVRCFGEKKIRGYPTITMDQLPIKSPSLQKLIKDIKNYGLEILVKDCSLGGKFPVIGVVIIDHKNHNYRMAFGADPIFDVALQRCITEIYQGKKTKDPISYSTKPFMVGGADITLEDISQDVGACAYEKAFLSTPKDNKTYLQFLIKKLQEDQQELFIRDFSYLGFPSYMVYIPQMSDMDHDYSTATLLEFDSIDRILPLLFSLPKKSAITSFCSLIEKTSSYDERAFFFYLKRLFKKAPLLEWLDPRLLVVFLFIEIEQFSKAQHFLRSPIADVEGNTNFIDPTLMNIVVEYCQQKLEAKEDRDILKTLEEKFAHTQYFSSLHHLVKNEYASFLRMDNSSMGQKFQGLAIPQCLDKHSCLTCPCNNKCYYDKWWELRDNIKNTMVPIDQKQLLNTVTQILQ